MTYIARIEGYTIDLAYHSVFWGSIHPTNLYVELDFTVYKNNQTPMPFGLYYSFDTCNGDIEVTVQTDCIELKNFFYLVRDELYFGMIRRTLQNSKEVRQAFINNDIEAWELL